MIKQLHYIGEIQHFKDASLGDETPIRFMAELKCNNVDMCRSNVCLIYKGEVRYVTLAHMNRNSSSYPPGFNNAACPSDFMVTQMGVKS